MGIEAQRIYNRLWLALYTESHASNSLGQVQNSSSLSAPFTHRCSYYCNQCNHWDSPSTTWKINKQDYEPFFADIQVDYDVECDSYKCCGVYSSYLGDAMILGLANTLWLQLIVFTSILSWPHFTALTHTYSRLAGFVLVGVPARARLGLMQC